MQTAITVEKCLWLIGSSIFVILGTIHLLYTFFTNKFSARDPQTEEMMKASFPVLTRKTTMWKAWMGFNASHSSGVIFFGIINLLFACGYIGVNGNSILFLCGNCLVSLFYLFLGFTYWFNVPRTGALISTICFVAATIISLIK